MCSLRYYFVNQKIFTIGIFSRLCKTTKIYLTEWRFDPLKLFYGSILHVCMKLSASLIAKEIAEGLIWQKFLVQKFFPQIFQTQKFQSTKISKLTIEQLAQQESSERQNGSRYEDLTVACTCMCIFLGYKILDTSGF